MSHEPTSEEVDSFVALHPGGGTLEQIAECFGVTRQRADQLVRKAVDKAQRALRWRRIHGVDDVV